jgi:hypothetical protein
MVQFEMCDEKGSYTEDIIFQIGDTIFVRGEDKKGTYYLSGTIKTIGSVILHLEFGKSVRLDEIYFVAKAGE